ncbi:polyphosphate kinase 1 [Salisaeta longa]|uniref:polyphosphate kinase 1 n=1 Tax=Salisaeta longa TaxID=503170 RepID=UPI000A047EF3|nr:polyphosphate kinase 1 [Salisaeta longa]
MPRSSDDAPSPSNNHAPPRAVVPQPVPEGASVDHASLYFNRELSWLDFNWRVLQMARDESTPLLERVRFLGITASNLDGFIRKRVGGLKRQAAAGVITPSPDGRTPEEQLALIAQAVRPMYRALGTTWTEALAPALNDAIGLRVRAFDALDEETRERLHTYFHKNIFPILTPLAVDPGRPFPFISNMSLSLAVVLRHPDRGTKHFARVKVPTTSRPRWVPLLNPLQFVPLEQVIAHHIDALFRGMDVEGVYAFRVTRNADVRRDEEEADDLIEMISERLRERRFAPVVRLEVERAMPEAVRSFLMDKLRVGAEDMYVADRLIDYSDLTTLADLHIPSERYTPALRFSKWRPQTPVRLQRDAKSRARPGLFSTIRSGDMLVHHPYESFEESVQRFIEEAVTDPQVLAIKQTLYRTSENSPIVDALIEAAERGKQVAVLVEVKARFDEEKNIAWARQLEDAGVHVAYGLVGLKTHAQAALVVRREADAVRTYCHISTGNYNAQTARQYTDLGLLSCHRGIGYDLTNLFHYLTGYAPEQQYNHLLVAPQDMRGAFLDKIEREIDHQRLQGNGHIMAKMNELGDRQIIAALYRAAQAGVTVELVVRGHCRLRPGLDGYSETVRVVSIVGRFLEHDRIFYFHNDGAPDVYISSADWQRSRLDDRVEIAAPILDADHKERLVTLLRTALDSPTGWRLQSDGRYLRASAAPATEGVQEHLMRQHEKATPRPTASSVQAP